MNQLRHRPAELVLLDLRMPGITGLDVLRSIRDVSPKCKVVLMTGFATIDSAVEAVKLGALDYLTKPFDLQRLRQLLATVRDEAAQRREVLTLEGDLAQRLEFCGMVGRGPAMQDVFGLIRRLAPHVRTALISGDTGTGKELGARALHRLGPRSSKRFVRAWIFLRQHRGGEEQPGEQGFPHDERELCLRRLSTAFSVAHLKDWRHAFSVQRFAG